MHVIKKIKFDLPIDGVKVKNLEELRDHFTVEVLELYREGKLKRWLDSCKLNDKINSLNDLELVCDDNFLLMRGLCEIFEIQVDDELIKITIGETNKSFPTLEEIKITLEENKKNTIITLLKPTLDELKELRREKEKLQEENKELMEIVANIDGGIPLLILLKLKNLKNSSEGYVK
jgi:hypothetical protein